jgi:4'-phosphopantetheinyl transferase
MPRALDALRVSLPGNAVEARVFAATLAEVRELADPDGILAPSELAHSMAFRQPEDRERFVAGRTLLRLALAGAAGPEPAAWRFRLGAHGKPAVEDGFPAIEFNVSHSGSCVAVAVGPRPVGIDIERLAASDVGDVVTDVLTDRERESLDRMSAEERGHAFIRIWTAKEACAKALGLGTSMNFREVDVFLDPLRVECSGSLADFAERFRLSGSTMRREGVSYVLSVAELASRAR